MTLRASLSLLARLFLSGLMGLFWVIVLSAYVEFSLLPAALYSLTVVGSFAVVHGWFAWPKWSAGRLQLPTAAMWRLLPVGIAAVLVLTLGRVAWFLVTGDLPPDEPTPVTELYLLPVLVTVAFPVIEEITFRAWMQKPLEDQIHPAVGIIAVAVIFAGFHSGGSFPLRFLMGCFYGATAWISGSVWMSVLLHAASNALIVPLDMASELPAVDQWLRATSAAGPMWLDVAAAVLIGGGSVGGATWIYWLWRRGVPYSPSG
jgi:membrane protease YdiL (CAAX protease family)